MKKILIPIDFSDCSMNAVEFGTEIARQVQAKIILMHAFAVPIPGITETLREVERMYVEEENEIHEKLKRIGDQIASYKDIYGNNLDCTNLVMQGGADGSIMQITIEQQPDLIIMGTVGNKGWENILGSTAIGVIRSSICPVLVIPSLAHYAPLKDILMAVDLPLHSIVPIKKTLDFSDIFGADITVVHVSSYKNEKREELYKLKTDCLNAKLDKLKFHSITSEKVEDGILQFLKVNDFQLVVLLKEEHFFLEGLFRKSFIKHLVLNSNKPILIMNDK